MRGSYTPLPMSERVTDPTHKYCLLDIIDSPTEPRTTEPRMTEPRKLDSKWTQPPNGLNPVWTQPRRDSTPNEPNPEWTQPQIN